VVTGLKAIPGPPFSPPSGAPAAGSGNDNPTAAPAAIRVVLADDHEFVRRSVRALLAGEHDIDVVAEASDMDSTRRLIREQRPSVLVLDLWMPGGTGVDAIEPLRGQVPDTQVVVMTMQDDPAFAEHVLGAGAIGFVVKEFAADELAQAVRFAARGERYVSPRAARRGPSSKRLSAGARPAGLRSVEERPADKRAVGDGEAGRGRDPHLIP
jgi:DNA-binding NarL/FixJ family response regulator